MAARKKQSEVGQMVSEIEQLELELRKLEESGRLRKDEIEALETEQRGYVVAARVHKDFDAQSNMERLAGEIAKRRTDDLFDCDAIAEVSASLEAKKAMLRREQWKERCGPLREALESRVTGAKEQKISELARELKVLLDEISRADSEIVAALRSIHPLLSQVASQVEAARNRRPEIVSHILDFESPFNATYRERLGFDVAGPAVLAFEQVLQKLEEIVAMEPPAERG